MARARSGNAVQTKLGFLIYGDKGTWKSSLCLQLTRLKREDGKPFRVLYIDPESGSIDSYLEEYQENYGVDARNVYIVYTQSLGEIRDYINKASNNEDIYELDDNGNETDTVVLDSDNQPFRPDAIVVDGTTIVYMATQQGLTEFSKKRARVKADRDKLVGEERLVKIEGAGLELKDYQTIKFKGHDLILDLLASGKHFAVTARETDEKLTKEINGKDVTVATGRKIPDGFKGMDYNVKTVLHTFIDEDGVVKAIVENKDRTKVHIQNEILIEPDLMDWQEAINKNKGKQEYVINNNLNKSIEREKQIYEREIGETVGDGIGANNSELITPEQYYKAIEEAIKQLTPMKKKSLQATVKKAELPMKYQELTDIDKLKTYLEIVSH